MGLFITQQALLTVPKAFDGVSIRSLKSSGEDVFKMLNALLYVTSQSLNVANNLNNFQAMDIIHVLMNDYADVKMEEMVYIFKQGKKGIYGPHYGKLDIENIIRWINGYFASEEYNTFLENRHRIPVEQVELTEQQKSNWKKTLESFKMFQKKQDDKNIPTDPIQLWNRLENSIDTLSEVELKYWLKEFEKLNLQTAVNAIKQKLDARI